MNLGFWGALPKPIMVLAPMAGVTDAAFRRQIARYGKPDVMWTEFVSTDGLCSAGREHLLMDLMYDPSERPIVGQIFGRNPAHFTATAELLQQLGYDGIDLNCGCPDKNVEKQGSGAALLKNPAHIATLVRATQAGAGPLPVSVKTRLGYKKNTVREILLHILEAEPAVITLHLRTREEMSDVPARWGEAAEAVQVVRDSGAKTLVFGNGDVTSLAQARQLAAQSGMDGVMIGRGIFGNPWLFNRDIPPETVTWPARLKVMTDHTFLYRELFGPRKNFDVMKKHFKAYVTGFPEAKDLRIRLMATHTPDEVLAIVSDFCQSHGIDYAALVPPGGR